MKFVAVLASLAIGPLLWAAQQESQQDSQRNSQKETQQKPTPTKEHQLLKAFEGEWDAVCRMTKEAGKPLVESKFRETNKMLVGGFWLMTEMKGEMEGKTVEGRGAMGWDPIKRKYVTGWIDSMYPHMFHAEGDADPTGKIITVIGEGIDPKTQKPCKEKLVFELGESDTRTLTFYKIEDGKETKTGVVTYTRRK